MNSEEIKEFIENFLDNHIGQGMHHAFADAVNNAVMCEDEQTKEDLYAEFQNYVLFVERIERAK